MVVALIGVLHIPSPRFILADEVDNRWIRNMLVPGRRKAEPGINQYCVQRILIIVIHLRRIVSNKGNRAFANLILPPIVHIDQHYAGIEVSGPFGHLDIGPFCLGAQKASSTAANA